MKNLSELMVDLSYSAVLFNSKFAAEEVLELEDTVNALNFEIKKQSMLAARSAEDAEKLTALLEIAEAAETIANSAKDIAELVINGIEPHPIFKRVMEESEEIIVRVIIENGSPLDQQTLGDLVLATRTGMRVIAIKRGSSWIYGPTRKTKLYVDDMLMAKGTETGGEILSKLAKNELELDEIFDDI